MTVTSNIVLGASAWAAQAYVIGNRRTNGGRLYEVTVAGTSSAAPTHTSGTVAVGGVTWAFKTNVDYTSLAAWQADTTNFPATLTQPIVGLLWRSDANGGEITSSSTYFTLTGHITTTSNTITLAAAPGESAVDGGDKALAPYDVTKGIAFRLTSNYYGQFFVVADDNVILDGLQIKNSVSGPQNEVIRFDRGSFSLLTLRRCILDLLPTTSKPALVANGNGTSLRLENCLVVDRGTGDTTAITLNNNNTTPGLLLNCTVIRASYDGAGKATKSAYLNIAYKNTAFFGFASVTGALGGGGTGVATNCITDLTGFGTGVTPTNCLTGKTASNQFVSTTSDFRLKAGADCINAGLADAAITTDIFGNVRG